MQFKEQKVTKWHWSTWGTDWSHKGYLIGSSVWVVSNSKSPPTSLSSKTFVVDRQNDHGVSKVFRWQCFPFQKGWNWRRFIWTWSPSLNLWSPLVYLTLVEVQKIEVDGHPNLLRSLPFYHRAVKAVDIWADANQTSVYSSSVKTRRTFWPRFWPGCHSVDPFDLFCSLSLSITSLSCKLLVLFNRNPFLTMLSTSVWRSKKTFWQDVSGICNKSDFVWGRVAMSYDNSESFPVFLIKSFYILENFF
jgi:hypothetical protein